MIYIKKPEEIEIMQQGGKILADVLWEVLDHVKPGVTELELDALSEKLIHEHGGEPGFQKVSGYHHTICVSTNDVVVHGIPSSYALVEGDVIGIDCGVFYKGFHTDMSETIQVKSEKSKVRSDEKVTQFLETGKEALKAGIKQAQAGNRVGNISKAIQDIVEAKGYSIVETLVGHGVGRNLHEEPEIPGFLRRSISSTPFLTEGMTIAVEVIYNMGKKDVIYANNDGWTIKTKDGTISAVFERTIAITQGEPLVLTK